MNNSTKIALAVAALAGTAMMVQQASAANPEYIEFTASVGGSCDFTAVSSGEAAINGTAVASTVNGSITVNNNDGDFYKVVAGDLVLAGPAGMSLTEQPTYTGAGWSGPNSSNGNPDGDNLSLASVGEDVYTMKWSGARLNQSALAGEYVFSKKFDCVPK